MAGTVFVTQGDVSQFQADAVVCPTSTYLAGHGFTRDAFARHFPEFDKSFRAFEEVEPVYGRGRRAHVGDAFWIPVDAARGRLCGIVLVAVTGGWESIEEKAALSVRNAIRLARQHLRKLKGVNGGRWLLAIPTIGLGFGGFTRELRVATETMVRTAAEEIRDPEEADGAKTEVDVAFVAYTAVNYRLLLDARRALGHEPPSPLEPALTQPLLQSVRQRRCVLFVGAGLSKPAGLPDWAGLLRDLAKDLRLDVDSLPRDSGGQLSLELCLDLAQWYADQFGPDDLNRRVHDLFGGAGGAGLAVRPTLAHYLLSSMPFRLFLTTNYDDLLERGLAALRRDPHVVCKPDAVFQTGQTEKPCVVKLHGCAAQRTKIILTRDDFDTFFRNHPVTAALLQGLLLSHTFLFVGYDLRDPNTRQVYSGVAHLLREAVPRAGAGMRAYSVVVRDEDATSRFYESQWERQGLSTLRLPGPDRIHSSLLFFDWLARQGCEVESFLHPDLQQEQTPAELGDLDALRRLLYQVGEQVNALLTTAGPAGSLAARTKVLAAVLDLVSRLGWKTGACNVWERLSEMTTDDLERAYFLRQALRAAEGVEQLDSLRKRLGGSL
jgi:O-acetyl-ADP-ribose deacetylase (regulator of RNase III)